MQDYDHRYWLRERFEEGKRRNPRWSLRAFAAQLGVSASTLSELLSEKRPLTPRMATRLANRLKLSEDQEKLMVRRALLARLEEKLPGDPAIGSLQDTKFQPLDLEVFSAVADWYHFAVLSLSEVRGSKANARWIARRLGITKEEATIALRRLVRLGLIEKLPGGRYRQTGKPLSIETEGYEPAIRSYLEQNLGKAAASLRTTPAPERELCAVTMAIDPKNLEKARRAIKRFRRELTDLLERGDKQRVYTLGIQLFPVDDR